MFLSLMANGVGLVGLSISGLVAPAFTENFLNTVLTSIPLLAPFPSSMDSPWAKCGLFSVLYLGSCYIGMSSSKEFAKYSVISRLFVFPVISGICIQLLGVPSAIAAFALLDVPCALWTRSELSKGSSSSSSSSTTTSADRAQETMKAARRIGRDRNLKMVLVVNMDLKMGKGKIAAQAAHAACGVLDEPGARDDPVVIAWQKYGCAKVALKGKFEDMKRAAALADEAGLRTYTVCDAGRTQIPAGSETVCAIGPFDVEEIDKITGRNGVMPLKLL